MKANIPLRDHKGQNLPVVEGLLYRIRNPLSNQVLNVSDARDNHGRGDVRSFSDNGEYTDHRLFQFVSLNGLYKIHNPASNQVLSVMDAGNAHQGSKDIRSCTDNLYIEHGHRSFQFIPFNGFYKIHNPLSNQILNVVHAHDRNLVSKDVRSFPDNREYTDHKLFQFIPSGCKFLAKISGFTYHNVETSTSQLSTSTKVSLIDFDARNVNSINLIHKVNATKTEYGSITFTFAETQCINFTKNFTVTVEASTAFCKGVSLSLYEEGEYISWERLGSNFKPKHTYFVKKTHPSYQQLGDTLMPPANYSSSRIESDKVGVSFKARLELSGYADRVTNENQKLTNTKVDSEGLRILLSHENYSYSDENVNDNTINMEITGNIDYCANADFSMYLLEATSEGNKGMVQFLIENGPEISIVDKSKAFTLAAQYQNADILNIFLEKGVDFKYTNENGSTALDLLNQRSDITDADLNAIKQILVLFNNYKEFNTKCAEFFSKLFHITPVPISAIIENSMFNQEITEKLSELLDFYSSKGYPDIKEDYNRLLVGDNNTNTLCVISKITRVNLCILLSIPDKLHLSSNNSDNCSIVDLLEEISNQEYTPKLLELEIKRYYDIKNDEKCMHILNILNTQHKQDKEIIESRMQDLEEQNKRQKIEFDKLLRLVGGNAGANVSEATDEMQILGEENSLNEDG